MSAIALLLVGLGAMALGYVFYSQFIAERIYRLDPNYRTPAHTMRDGVDYVPTNKFVLWGHHFTSVAGAAPIVGPAIAVIWGWGPAFAWVVFGTIFFAGVHDFGALWASARSRGQSVGMLSGRLIGSRGRSLFLVVIFLVLLMVNGAFAAVISNLLVSTPTSVIPVWGAILVALVIGQMIYRYNMKLLWPSLGGVIVLYALILIGNQYPIVLPDEIMGLSAKSLWILLLFVYAAIASLLPVWVLLQPRDYINGLQLFVGLGLLYLAVLFGAPELVAPAFNQELPADTPSIVPLLFVTIACGAISGFHGLVASGTTSKQLDKETDARFVGYFGAMGEGMLSLAAIICCTAGFATLTDWQQVYTAFGSGGVTAFVQGGGTLLANGLGLPAELGGTILAVMAILFAGTTMDTGLRLQRFVIQEAGELAGMKVNTLVGTLIAVGVCMALAFGAGSDGTGGMVIWPLFGTTNQLLAGLTLAVITVILIKLGRSPVYTLVPLVFLLAMSIYALLVQMGQFYRAENWLLLGMDVIILIAALWVTLEAIIAMRKGRDPAERAFEAQP
ncbi:carbon starvation CstA family protein [Stutzerimonas stutzeri]|uniref:Carbon starvation protein CstA n=1 Tax=Stutzerimonas stutzeri (strain ATCC 17588 / DSM 5190 / CCUG 11256 / JCM 5965 / LMG 11199 / NBRC 14165 / NCIMB 11358 / Stanier 221) TaxID=96563 RepID=F8H724_STUS2|nr:carbon starvation protein A [Stutzerimonas stutzeri]AEJ03689.1 carbon starvation protein CstA [Stutzerimonas stutzeri]AVX11628.1 carbon starvation protein A [Stutzerimonas stutzeri]MCW8160284.1 carbon starvation protein A [Stutzerimonas stutzeri]QPT28779.1 carbon starvation protein A [Stutzerimonas stutzeri]RRV90068.1 carbon starvation protein A [Stutzerimonas stutzeri]